MLRLVNVVEVLLRQARTLQSLVSALTPLAQVYAVVQVTTVNLCAFHNLPVCLAVVTYPFSQEWQAAMPLVNGVGVNVPLYPNQDWRLLQFTLSQECALQVSVGVVTHYPLEMVPQMDNEQPDPEVTGDEQT